MVRYFCSSPGLACPKAPSGDWEASGQSSSADRTASPRWTLPGRAGRNHRHSRLVFFQIIFIKWMKKMLKVLELMKKTFKGSIRSMKKMLKLIVIEKDRCLDRIKLIKSFLGSLVVLKWINGNYDSRSNFTSIIWLISRIMGYIYKSIIIHFASSFDAHLIACKCLIYI